jgi:hypothetical protein
MASLYFVVSPVDASFASALSRQSAYFPAALFFAAWHFCAGVVAARAPAVHSKLAAPITAAIFSTLRTAMTPLLVRQTLRRIMLGDAGACTIWQALHGSLTTQAVRR